jgi:serine/threonine-protein kinase
MSSIRERLQALSPADRLHYETLIDRFESYWAERPDAPPGIADHLPPDEPLRTLVLVALVKSDLESRLRQHGPTPIDDYLGRFPELSHDTQATAELLAWNHYLTHPKEGKASLPGSAGRYLVQEPVGRGGIGIVCRGRDPQLDRELAVKILRADHAGNPALVGRFEQEARVVGRLQHPGVVPVYDSGRLPDGRPWFIMRLVQGRTLAQLLGERHDPQHEPARFLAIFAQVCQTLAYAHEQGVIHRDLKPSNIMVGAFGEVQVMDWGLAKMLPGPGGAEDAPPGQPAAGPVTTLQTESAGLSSQAGTVLGTPAYMAPEQARGEVERLDERCDVFGLGAVLCEVLTGWPPYTGASVLPVRERAARGDLEEAWKRLDRCGAAAELVALARCCLEAEPAARPRNAAEVAEAVGRHLAEVQQRLHEAERERAAAEARAEEATARTRLERRARRLTAGLAAAALVLMVGVVWFWQQTVGQRQAVAEALTKATGLRERYQYSQAQEVLEQAERWVDRWSRQRLEEALADLRLVQRLDDIRARAIELTPDGRMNWRAADEEYKAVFRDAGLGEPEDLAEAVAARVRRSAVRTALVAALDDWAVRTEDETRRAWLLEVARRADLSSEGGTGDWGERFRDPEVRQNLAKLTKLAEEADVSRLAPQTLYALALALAKQGGNALPLLRSAQDQHPADFWLTFQLAGSLYVAKRYGEAEGYYRTVRALRPDSAVVHTHLGTALEEQGKREEAVACHRRAIDLDSMFALAHGNLGVALANQGKLEEAVACSHRALELDPKYVTARYNLGNALKDQGKVEEAVACYHQAIALDPKFAPPHHNLGIVLAARGKLDEAVACYRRALERDPQLAQAHNNLGKALEMQGNREEAIASTRRAIELDPKFAGAHTNLGIFLARQGKVEAAAANFHRAIELDPKFAGAHGNFGVALAARGKLEEAIACYRRALELDPKYVMTHTNLGVALLEQGKLQEAMACFRRALQLDPKYAAAQTGLRDCQRLVELEPRLSGLLAGIDHPADLAERLEFAQLCTLKQRFAAAAELYAEAFAAQPRLAAELRAGHRYSAACSAVRAGCGQGVNADALTAGDRLRWRRQALTWLRDDLAGWTRLLQGGGPATAPALTQTLRDWQTDPDLAGLRDPAHLTRLSAEERAACQRLWADVAALLRLAQSLE